MDAFSTYRCLTSRVQPAPPVLVLPLAEGDARAEHGDFMAVAAMPEEVQLLVLQGLSERFGFDVGGMGEGEILYVRLGALAELTDGVVRVELEETPGAGIAS